jgi:hypothetical protein
MYNTMLNDQIDRDRFKQLMDEAQQQRLVRSAQAGNKKQSSILRNMINNIKSITS